MNRRITLLAFEDVQALDVVGPLEVFAQANRFAAECGAAGMPAYEIEIVAAHAGALRTSAGFSLVAARGLAEHPGGINTLLVAGGAGVHRAAADPQILAWLRAQAPHCRRVGSICTGTFVLAAAGLLDGRRATTHWRSCALFAERHPQVRLEPDAIAVRDGNVYSSAGVTAGMDLALALVEEDGGRHLPLAIARNLVLYLRRSGGQSQYSAHLAGAAARTPPIQAVQGWILANLTQPITVPALAERAGMSPRNFARVFAADLGLPPGQFVERARVDQARRLLCAEDTAIEGVAGRAGFPTAEAMRRAFLRHLGVTPRDYRARFSDSPSSHSTGRRTPPR